MQILARRLSCVPHALLRSVALFMGCALNAASPSDLLKAAPDLDLSFECRYTATAYITFLTIPILSRAEVGFGFADADEHLGSGTQKISLRFLGGSIPERARGLNRFGFIQENVEQRNQAMISADYFGLITTNGEESFSEGKAALNSEAKKQVAVTAVRAFMNQESTSYTRRQLLVPASYASASADEMLKQLRAEFGGPWGDAEKTESFSGQPTGTFLNCLRQAILTAAPVYTGRIVFNGKIFRFKAEKRADPKTGADLHKQGITRAPDRVTELTATLRNEKTKE